jgi:hypothetical protein
MGGRFSIVRVKGDQHVVLALNDVCHLREADLLPDIGRENKGRNRLAALKHLSDVYTSLFTVAVIIVRMVRMGRMTQLR